MGASPSEGSSRSIRPGSRHERAPDRQHLLLATAQRPRQLRPPLGQDGKARVHALERAPGWLACPTARRHPSSSSRGRSAPERARGPRGRARCPGARSSRDGRPSIRRPRKVTVPRGGGHQPGDALERGGLPGAVGAQQRDDRALGHLERDAPERLDAAVERLDPVEVRSGSRRSHATGSAPAVSPR